MNTYVVSPTKEYATKQLISADNEKLAVEEWVEKFARVDELDFPVECYELKNPKTFRIGHALSVEAIN